MAYKNKYSSTEHLLYYYVLCGFFIILLALYKKYFQGERIKFIESEDLWIYIIVAAISAIIILKIFAQKNENIIP